MTDLLLDTQDAVDSLDDEERQRLDNDIREELAFWRRTALELYAEQHKLQLPLREKYIEEMLLIRLRRTKPPELFEGCTAQERALLIAYELADGGGA